MADTFIQYKYITIIGNYLQGFKLASKNLWNFRCPICGDSEKNKNKRRGYIYLKDSEYRYHCHNCGVDKSFKNFLYEVSPEIYAEYRKENAFLKIKADSTADVISACSTQHKKLDIVHNKHLTPVSELENGHPAAEYLRNRGVPQSKYGYVFWTEDYDALISESFGDLYKNVEKLNSGIVFDIRQLDDPNHPVIGYQIRSIDTNIPKSKRFMICKEQSKSGVFGINRLDFSKTIYVVEGPIDSLFLPNCIAVFTSALWRANMSDAVYINDCEPRNAQIVDQVKRCIDKGYKTVLLPNQYNSLDVNDIVMKYNLNESELVKLVEQYTFSGLTAKMKFSQWRRFI